MPHYRNEKTNKIHFYKSVEDKDKHLAFLETPTGKKLGLNLHLKPISDVEEYKILNKKKPLEQKIKEMERRYKKEVQKVCTDNMLDNINSARFLSRELTSPLQRVSGDITDWELQNQKKFIDFFNGVKNGELTIESHTFEDNFNPFVNLTFTV